MFPGRLRSSPALAYHYSAFRIPHSAFRSWPAIRQRRAPPPQAEERLRPEVCQVHFAFRIPHSEFRIVSRFIIDQRVPPLGEVGPGLHLDDVIQHRPSDPECDLPGGALERAPPPGARRGARITREQLELRGARSEGGELDDEPLYRSGGPRPL